MEEEKPALMTIHQREVRAGVAEVLNGVAFALLAGAVSVFGLMVVVYIGSGDDAYSRDWPGVYWFAVLPLLAAALVLNMRAGKIGQALGDDGDGQ